MPTSSKDEKQKRVARQRKTIFALLIAGGLAVTPIIAAYQNNALSNHARNVITLVSILSSLAVGIAAAFGLRRSV